MQHSAKLIYICLIAGSLASGAFAADTYDSTPPEVAMISAPGGAARIRVRDLRKITVDASAPVGRLRSLQGVNGAPAPGAHKPENFKFGGWNVSAGYRMARIDLVRTHDAYGPADIDAKFESASAPDGGSFSARRHVFNIFPRPPPTSCTFRRPLMLDCSHGAASRIETTPVTTSRSITCRRIAAIASSAAGCAGVDFASPGTTLHTSAPIRLRDELPPPGVELITIRLLDDSPGLNARGGSASPGPQPHGDESATAARCAAPLAAQPVK